MSNRFQEFGFPLHEIDNVIPDDTTTLFVCSGMQNLKPKFDNPDGSKYGSSQHCIRTNDIELVGDGSHLTSFQMIGNFSFGGNDYHTSVSLWDFILKDLNILPDEVQVHPDSNHRSLWEDKGFRVVDNPECVWTDGNIGGYCCELFVKGLEIGNLVNTLGVSTDVGFGLERLLQVVEGKDRVDETSLFRQDVDPLIRDHERTLLLMKRNGVVPGYKGRSYICRRLLRRMIQLDCSGVSEELQLWIQEESKLREKCLTQGFRVRKRHRDKPDLFWWQTFGILPDEVKLIKESIHESKDIQGNSV